MTVILAGRQCLPPLFAFVGQILSLLNFIFYLLREKSDDKCLLTRMCSFKPIKTGQHPARSRSFSDRSLLPSSSLSAEYIKQRLTPRGCDTLMLTLL